MLEDLACLPPLIVVAIASPTPRLPIFRPPAVAVAKLVIRPQLLAAIAAAVVPVSGAAEFLLRSNNCS